MRILLLGANGQLGQELSRTLHILGEVWSCGRAEVNLTDSAAILAAIDSFQPDVIVNAAAYTAVDRAEREPELAFEINANAVGVLANEAFKRDIWLIHYSTDYVFDGTKNTPYSEKDTPNPINVYGKSKLFGEQTIIASGCKYLIFRTSWVIGQEGQNFAKTILRLAKERTSLNVIDDQLGVPTTPSLIAKVTINAIEAIKSSTAWPLGIYNLAPQGKTTWFGIAKVLIKLAKQEQLQLKVIEKEVHPILSVEYPTPANRPTNSLMITSKLKQHLNFNLPDWKSDFSKTAKNVIKDIKSS